MTSQLVDETPPAILEGTRPTVVRPSTLLLPHPPSDSERDAYLGPQQRWVALVSFIGYSLIVTSVSFFVVRHLWAAWLLIPLTLSIIGTTVSLLTSSRRRRDSLE